MGEGPEESPVSGSSTGSPGVGWVPRFAEVPAALNALRGVCQSVHSQVWWKNPRLACFVPDLWFHVHENGPVAGGRWWDE